MGGICLSTMWLTGFGKLGLGTVSWFASGAIAILFIVRGVLVTGESENAAGGK
jgi:hypothetical protein